MTINDPTAPAVTVEASGLLAGGARSGSDPVTVTASDNSGIRKVELLDVSNPAAPMVVGVEDYTIDRTTRTRSATTASPRRARACARDRAGDVAARRPALGARCA